MLSSSSLPKSRRFALVDEATIGILLDSWRRCRFAMGDEARIPLDSRLRLQLVSDLCSLLGRCRFALGDEAPEGILLDSRRRCRFALADEAPGPEGIRLRLRQDAAWTSSLGRGRLVTGEEVAELSSRSARESHAMHGRRRAPAPSPEHALAS